MVSEKSLVHRVWIALLFRLATLEAAIATPAQFQRPASLLLIFETLKCALQNGKRKWALPKAEAAVWHLDLKASWKLGGHLIEIFVPRFAWAWSRKQLPQIFPIFLPLTSRTNPGAFLSRRDSRVCVCLCSHCWVGQFRDQDISLFIFKLDNPVASQLRLAATPARGIGMIAFDLHVG